MRRKDTNGEKLKDKPLEDLPRPGAYQEKSFIKEGPQNSIYMRREHKIEQNSRSRRLRWNQKSGKGVTIGVKFKDHEQEDLSGPCNYEDKSRIIEGPQF